MWEIDLRIRKSTVKESEIEEKKEKKEVIKEYGKRIGK